MAIVLDDKVLSSPQVDQQVGCGVGIVGGSTNITGKFTDAEAKDLALLISAGSLPVPVEIIEQHTVGPTLGASAITSSAWAAVIGLALTAFFMLVVYRLAGLVAVVALLGYALVSYAALLAVGATLTLPGLAGFVLAIGMAVDATVLMFERAREEHAAKPGAPLLRAADRGFRGGAVGHCGFQGDDAAGGGPAVLAGVRAGARIRCHARHWRAGLDVHFAGADPPVAAAGSAAGSGPAATVDWAGA